MLIERCRARGVSVYRFNTEDFPSRTGLTVDPRRPEKAALLDEHGLRVEVGNARGIWLRRPAWPVISPEVRRESDQKLAAQESIAALGGLWRLLASKCVSAPDALQSTRWKLPQLQLAHAVGFSVPSSLVTTSTATARDFTGLSPAVLKSIQEMAVDAGNESHIGFVDQVEPDDLTNCEVAPVLLQRLTSKVADWRITVVGNAVFGARIDSEPGAPIDVRNGARPRAQELAVPDTIADGCRTFIMRMGLRFGAFDFGEDATGHFWFFECNPNGQWGWIELLTGLPITDAIVTELLFK